jgi:hypothetical protein
MDETDLLRSLQNWDLGEVFELAPLPGGINAETWKLKTPRGSFVGKFASDKTAFEGGLEIAEQLELAGFLAGRPVRKRDGSLLVVFPEGALGVLAFIPGSALMSRTQRECIHGDQRWRCSTPRYYAFPAFLQVCGDGLGAGSIPPPSTSDRGDGCITPSHRCSHKQSML